MSNRTARIVIPRRSPLLLVGLVLVLSACGGGGSGGTNATPAAPTPAPPAPTPPAPSQQELAAASKLLARTTFGADYALIDAVAGEGLDTWFERQLRMPVSLHEPIVRRYLAEYGFDINADPPPGTYRRFAFWEQALTAPDQLRQVVAHALTQVFVVSDGVDAIAINPLALSSYYDMLLNNAFGNYRDLLRAVTLHPVMGVYLSHVNNARTNPVTNTFPDENYAREVMQLFSIGLFELNEDGSQRLDGAGNAIPTYDNSTIREFAKIFTGLSFGPVQPGGSSYFGKEDPVLHVPMRMFESFHEPDAKFLLNGEIIPAGQTGMEDIEAANDKLFNQPNVGPFFGRLLIQRLVTSNPSPAYVARVSAAFAGDGTTSRGDMSAVLRAVLFDPEASSGVKLREPFLRYVAINRSLHATSDDGTFPGYGYVAQFLTQQHVLSAPSVFNFYLPGFLPPGELGDAGMAGPEFQITTESTVVGMTNLIAYALYTDNSIDTPDSLTSIRLDLSEYTTLAPDSEELLDRIDLVFFANTMTEDTRTTIVEAIAPLTDDLLNRARLALYLSLASPDYAIQGGG